MSQTSIGDQIMRRRLQRGLSREVLAGLVGRSGEWLRQVEASIRAVDSIRVAARLGEVLGDDLYDIIVNRPAVPHPQRAQADPIGSQLRAELTMPDWLPSSSPAAVAGPDVGQLWQVWWHAPFRTAEVTTGLMRLLPELRVARQSTPSDTAAIGAGVEAFGLARSLLTFVGERRLALVVAERAATIATPLNGPVAAAAGRGLALAHLQNRQATSAQLLAVQVARHLGEQQPLIRGSLLSVAAKAAARTGQPDEALDLLAEAAELAAAIKHDTHEHGIWFGPADVALTRMTVAWMLGRHAEVISTAETFTIPPTMPAHHRTPYHALVAALYAERNDVGTAIAQLLEIERISPEAFRYSRMVHHALRSLLDSSHPIFNADIRRMAYMAGLYG